ERADAMANAMSVADWKSVLKQNPDAADGAPLTKALEAFGKAEGKAKDDPEPLLDAIEDVLSSAKAARSKNAKKEKVIKFLDTVLSAAAKEKVKAERLAQEKK